MQSYMWNVKINVHVKQQSAAGPDQRFNQQKDTCAAQDSGMLKKGAFMQQSTCNRE